MYGSGVSGTGGLGLLLISFGILLCRSIFSLTLLCLGSCRRLRTNFRTFPCFLGIRLFALRLCLLLLGQPRQALVGHRIHRRGVVGRWFGHSIRDRVVVTMGPNHMSVPLVCGCEAAITTMETVLVACSMGLRVLLRRPVCLGLLRAHPAVPTPVGASVLLTLICDFVALGSTKPHVEAVGCLSARVIRNDNTLHIHYTHQCQIN